MEPAMSTSEVMSYFLDYEQAGDRLYSWADLLALHGAEDDLCRQWDDEQEWKEYA